MKKYIGYTGKFPRSNGHSFDGLLESLKQDEKLWVEKEEESDENSKKSAKEEEI